jgi:hypothetical protein
MSLLKLLHCLVGTCSWLLGMCEEVSAVVASSGICEEFVRGRPKVLTALEYAARA